MFDVNALQALAANELYEWLVLAQDAREEAYAAGDYAAEAEANEQCEALVAEAIARQVA
jgi:hypothetical protein